MAAKEKHCRLMKTIGLFLARSSDETLGAIATKVLDATVRVRVKAVADVRGGGFFGSRLHQLPPRLLQCLAVRHCRRPTSATAIGPERH